MKIIAYGSLLAVESTLSLVGQILEGTTSSSVGWAALGLALMTTVPTARSFAHALFDYVNGEAV